jgi:acyl carrier protein
MDDIRAIILDWLADVTDRPGAGIAALPGDTGLFSPAIGLDSLAGTELLSRIHEHLGVDIVEEDIELRSLETIQSLVDFVRHAIRNRDNAP